MITLAPLSERIIVTKGKLVDQLCGAGVAACRFVTQIAIEGRGPEGARRGARRDRSRCVMSLRHMRTVAARCSHRSAIRAAAAGVAQSRLAHGTRAFREEYR
jgi:hypothetical protein